MENQITIRELRKFGLGWFIILGVIAALLFWRGRPIAVYFFCLSFIGGFLAIVWPTGLRLLHQIMMMVAGFLAWINTRIILTVVFVLIFVPIGLFLRLIGKDLLNKKNNPGSKTYWIEGYIPPFDPKEYHRQF